MANVPLLLEPNYGTNAMTYLQMLQRLQQESSTSGTVPSTCQNVTGDLARLCGWINQAWVDIQNERSDWFFMEQPVSFNTIVGQQAYNAAQAGLSSFANYDISSFRQYNVSMGFGSEQSLLFASTAGSAICTSTPRCEPRRRCRCASRWIIRRTFCSARFLIMSTASMDSRMPSRRPSQRL